MVLAAWSAASAETRMLREGFDSPRTSWTVESTSRLVQTSRHRRNGTFAHDGGASEEVVFSSKLIAPRVVLTHRAPPAKVFDELTASLWVYSNQVGAQLGVRIRFPHQIDPRTEEPMWVDLLGPPCRKANQWQQISCRTSQDAIDAQLRRLRSQLRSRSGTSSVDTRDFHVDRIVLHMELPAGTTSLHLDDLEFGPIISPDASAESTESVARTRESTLPRVSIGDDRLLIDGQPFLPIFTPYHGESIRSVAESGVNVLWIRDASDAALLQALKDENLFAMAEPPRPPDREIGVSNPDAIGLLPLTSETEPILMWNLGTQLKPDVVQQTATWANMVRDADFRMARPVLADVVGSERDYHRDLDLVGSSRHCLHTSTSPRAYFDLLRWKRRLSLPDKPSFTFVQTEPSTANLAGRPEARVVPVVEPEQIFFQVYAAIAAGYKGIGYWKHTPLTTDAPGGDERRLAMSLVNTHLKLLEPWVATGKVSAIVPVTLGAPEAEPAPPRGRRFGLPLKKLLPGDRSSDEAAGRPPSEILAADIRSEHGVLILPIWLEEGAQFQPGPMTANEVSFVIAPPGEILQVWEVTTTGVAPLPHQSERFSGGTRIRISGFDQYSAILITHNSSAIEPLHRRIAETRTKSARDWIDLASAKLTRVISVHNEVAELAPRAIRSDSVLAEARRRIERAEREFERGNYDEVRRESRVVMQMTRSVQRADWEQATGQLTSGVSSPYTICFQTLPDHWRLIAAIGKRERRSENLLRSGNFEDAATVNARWEHKHSQDDAVRPAAELSNRSAEGSYSLRMHARPADPSRPPGELDVPPVRFVSPAIRVYAGQIVLITGKVQLASPVSASLDGLVVTESLLGTVGALRWNQPTPENEWESFTLIREVTESGDLHVALELRGFGDARVDDLQIIAVEAD
ncbi:MAG: hypothetical protein DWQ34_28670 [Planctomycetota bacterium]|nr:MAG: hypothetical protein DWQ34_28670 [Planctomycetota bacterium]REK26046.1 MAG: hypothetical protein DWQ41_10325 [Planctomycetota bacterium]REK31870.1 MAG: hypothetical protein DWQ45_18235 [Planctomycetota bacterium]